MTPHVDTDLWRERSRPTRDRDRRDRLDRFTLRTAHALDRKDSAGPFHAIAARAAADDNSDRSATDTELRERAHACAQRYALGRDNDDALVEALRIIRELASRTLGLRPYPVQLAAGAAIASGRFVELATGEGKTLVATIPAIIDAWRGRGCHVLTANDYLVERDHERNAPLYRALGLASACVVGATPRDARAGAYRAGITYLTAKEACADHLRDRLLTRRDRSFAGSLAYGLAESEQQPPVQRGLASAVVDEADSLLIDEAGTPLVLSVRTAEPAASEDHARAHRVAVELRRGEHFTVRPAHHEVTLTRAGHTRVGVLSSGWGGLWNGPNRRAELVLGALRALLFYEHDRDYVISEGRIVIVDPNTGRPMPDRTWRQGLHQAIEAKEGLDATAPADTSASLSFQRFFRRYDRLAGMSGTLREVAPELRVVYRAPTVTLPTHRPLIRTREPTLLYRRSDDRWDDVASRVRTCVAAGRPVLVGTRSVGSSERLSAMLTGAGVAHEVLNARRHDEEARIIARAGRAGAVTIATSMAGRGTDIVLEDDARDAGGLHVIVAEMHDAARVDRQLLGRAGRQGDPGSGVVLASVEDELFERYAPPWLRSAATASGGRTTPTPLAGVLIGTTRRRARAHARSLRARLRESDERTDDAIAFAGAPI